MGLFRHKRLQFGINSAAEIFQHTIRTNLSDIPGVRNFSDDIIVFGSSQTEHDHNLKMTLDRLRECGLTLNKKKCIFNQSSVSFYGHVFSKEGISPDPSKISAVLQMKTPQNQSEVRSLLGFTNFCARFVPGYTSLTHSLRQLVKQDTKWKWTSEHEQSLKNLKQSLAAATTTAYFDVSCESTIYVDASPVGLGAILTQKQGNETKIIAYGSRVLTDTEKRYSQTEREALAVVWACEHFNIYVYGKPFSVCTDHKPLVSIFSNPKTHTSARIERWCMRLQPYDVTVTYQRGSDNPADYMSRHPTLNKANSREQKIAEEYINYISSHAIPKAMTVKEVATATARDNTLQHVIKCLDSGIWTDDIQVNSSIFSGLKNVKGELAYVPKYKILLRGRRIVVPEELQQRCVNLAHESHLGIVKTKALLREKVWFSGIDKLVDSTVRQCLSCQSVVHMPVREPLKMSPLPQAPWEEVSADFAHLSNGEYLLVVSDDYSRFPIVEVINSTSAATVIPKLDKIFSEYGTPAVLRTDNGPPFNSIEFENFSTAIGFKHRRVTPLWPRANGEVERFMKTVKKNVTISILQKRNWRKELVSFLRSYRVTPHCTTGVAPATLMFSRSVRTKFPQLTTECDKQDFETRDSNQKMKMKKYADNKQYVKPSNIDIGNKVLVKNNPGKKKSVPYYKPNPYTVVQRNGSMISAERNGHTITRNSSFFKQLDPAVQSDMEDESDDDDSDLFESPNPVQQQLGDNGEYPDIVPVPVPVVPQQAVRQPQRTQQQQRRCPERDRHLPKYLDDYVLR